ncbi:ribosome biogenesis protein SLX9 homolog [Drosophila nasuta]|uniref:Ribosome biogenesis protein SLX9 homolog n=1 Tax=Drosophila albomicans TaxID=7291 RepID=A0A6P8X0U8_DROAB|nr:ribosome biogenesis protein SLX9 homolog [Drosophila albomicans]XP_060653534.1 ribosome biogenesis protein SLX9 homolog [Drosophila nasuta]
MAKRNIRAKAKSAIGAVKQKANEAQAKLKKAERQENMLHKTLSPKQTATKKEKSAQKHTKLLKRFVTIKKEVKEENARKNREKAKVVGDLKPLRDALPALGDIYDLVRSSRKPAEDKSALAEPEKLSAKKKIKTKREEYVKKVQSFEKLIKDKNFKKNPREAISNHLRNKYQAMEEDDDE